MTLGQTIRNTYPHESRLDPISGCGTCRLDDRGPHDYFDGFCEITVTIRPDEALTLTLRHPPLNDGVRTVVDDHNGRIHSLLVPTIVLNLPATDAAAVAVRDLAVAIKGVTRRGQRYPEKNWKWLAPRTAASLAQFARLLTRHHRPSKKSRASDDV
jgi:hypothetical protein